MNTIAPLIPSLMNARVGTAGHVECSTKLIHFCNTDKHRQVIESQLPTFTLKSASISSVVKSNAALWFVRPAFTTIPCGPSLHHNLVYRGRDADLLLYIGLGREELVGKALG